MQTDKDVKFLLAEGMVIVSEELDTRDVRLECAAPILRGIILAHVIGPKINVPPSELPPDLSKIDPRWLLALAIQVSNIRGHYNTGDGTLCIHSVLTECLFLAELGCPAHLHQEDYQC